MAKSDDGRRFVERLKDCGVFGFPFHNFLYTELMKEEPRQLFETLKKLEANGYIKISGPRTLNDFGAEIEQKSAAVVSLEQQKQAKTAGETNSSLLLSDGGFFNSDIRLTLKARFVLATSDKLSLSKKPAPLPHDAVQRLENKKRNEQVKRASQKPSDDFNHVISDIARLDPSRINEKIMDGDLNGAYRNIYQAHVRLIETNAVYKDSFETYKKLCQKFDGILEKQEKYIEEGGVLSKVIENPFNRVVLLTVFAGAVHLPSTVKINRSYNKMLAIYNADQETATALPSSVAPVKNTHPKL